MIASVTQLSDSLLYQPVFDIGRQGPRYWWLLGVPVLVIGLGYVIVRENTSPGRRLFFALWAGFAGVIELILAVAIAGEYLALRSALAHGHYRLVEGVVTEFVPADRADRRDERFSVVTPSGRYEYAYSWAKVTQGFNRSRPHGGPLREGVRVRIADVDGMIARLEIAP